MVTQFSPFLSLSCTSCGKICQISLETRHPEPYVLYGPHKHSLSIGNDAKSHRLTLIHHRDRVHAAATHKNGGGSPVCEGAVAGALRAFSRSTVWVLNRGSPTCSFANQESLRPWFSASSPPAYREWSSHVSIAHLHTAYTISASNIGNNVDFDRKIYSQLWICALVSNT